MMGPLHTLGFTPNMLTTVGNILRAISVYYLYKNQKNKFAVFYMLGYFFDCLDGHYARTYGMETTFGDYYDHISDSVFYLIVMYYLVTKMLKSKNVVFARIVGVIYLFVHAYFLKENFGTVVLPCSLPSGFGGNEKDSLGVLLFSSGRV